MNHEKFIHSATGAAWIPALQAVLTGLILGLAALVLAYVFKAPQPWAWAGVVFVVSLAITWLHSQRRWHAMTWQAPPALYPDVTAYPVRPTLPAPEVFVRVYDETTDGIRQESRGTLPCTLAQAQDLARGLLDGQPITEREWAGPGKPFSSAGWRSLRDELVRRGMLAAMSDKDPRAGYRLTRAGRAAMQAFAREDTPTLPD